MSGFADHRMPAYLTEAAVTIDLPKLSCLPALSTHGMVACNAVLKHHCRMHLDSNESCMPCTADRDSSAASHSTCQHKGCRLVHQSIAFCSSCSEPFATWHLVRIFQKPVPCTAAVKKVQIGKAEMQPFLCQGSFPSYTWANEGQETMPLHPAL